MKKKTDHTEEQLIIINKSVNQYN